MSYDKERYHNLLERLDPKYRAMLDVVSQTYPYSIQKIKNELDNNIFYMDLTVGCVMSLYNYLDLRTNDLYNLSMLFGSSMYKDEPKQSVDNGIQERTKYVGVSGE